MLPDIQPGNTKILYFFNCLLDGMHTKACENSDFSKKVSWWWLRSPGDDRYCAAVVNSDGWVYGDGSRVNGSDDGVRPALHLHLSSSNLFSYAGIVSSDGTENEVPYNTRTRLVQN